MAAGSWTLADELFRRGDAAFGAELRRVHDPERMGAFAATWFADRRPFARDALFDYLAQPLNCYRHEALVKRLFKLAEKAGDDALIGAFLVAFDRSVRRQRRTVYRSKQSSFPTRAEAEAALRRWEQDGFKNGSVQLNSGRAYAYATRSGEVVVVPGNTTMPRPPKKSQKRAETLEDAQRTKFEKKFRLFSLPTRRYLRRRAWRYFRKLGKTDPQRYLTAAGSFLPRYTDADVDSDIHLLDNWGLTHALFHDCPALRRPASGWWFVAGKGLPDLAFAPKHAAIWAANADLAFELLLAAGCRTVRVFAIWLLRTHHAEWLRQQTVGALLKLADHADPDVSAFGFDLLETCPDLSRLPVSEWLRRLDGDDLDKLTRFSGLLERRLDPARVSNEDAVRLAAYRAKPVAALGLAILKSKSFTEAGPILPLTGAECDIVRPEIVAWLRATLDSFGPAKSEWVLEFLDAKHADVRAAGWEWLNATAVKDDPAVWLKLTESPYDDVRGPVADLLSHAVIKVNPDSTRWLWAAVLLNVHRGGRQKPGVVKRIVDRAAADAAEAEKLMPLLAVAVRSLRGPEFRAGLAGVVTLCEINPGLRPLIARQFPELVF